MKIKLIDGRTLDALPKDVETAALVCEVGGNLDASGYAHPLPALQSIGVNLYATGYAHPLPALQSIGVNLYATGYAHPLPALQSIGGYLISDAPFIENIHQKIYAAASGDDRFDMRGWGRETACGTGRCRGGHVVNAAGAAGFALRNKTGWTNAAMLIYLKSDPKLYEKGYPDFSGGVKNADALADMKRCAELEAAAVQ